MSPSFPDDAARRPVPSAAEADAATILVVDDEPALLRLMEFLLTRQGYHLITASNGEEALEVIRARRPDLIVMDIMMPKLDGYQVTEALRADPDPGLAAIPILMLSAKAQDEDIARGLEVGGEAYITKPFDPELLAVAVAAMLRGEPVPDPPAMTPTARTGTGTTN
ncbi:MAG: response regulator [Cytophagales bacterium]|nr:response regulator [Armatimonadota bacterium]